MSLFVRSRWRRRGRRNRPGVYGEGSRGRDSYDRSSDFALLEAQFRLLRPNAREGPLPFFSSPSLPSSSSSSWRSLLTRGSLILSSLLCLTLTCLPARPRPQFPPILFSKQVCKTQFSRRLTSHLIARWKHRLSSLLLTLFILPAIVAFIFPSMSI